mgnify:CR=1 FL=1
MSRTVVIADLHVHWHPYYDAGCLWRTIVPRLRRFGGGSADIVLCWTESRRCHAFDRLACGDGPWPVGQAASGGAALWIENSSNDDGVWIVRGQQIVTAERLEILAIGARDDGWEGQPADQVIRAVRDVAAPALIPWAPGKWWGRRGRLLHELIQRWPPEELMLVDSSLRPWGWPLPRPLRPWKQRGHLLAGSDPLETPGEERQIGRYATRLAASLDARDPVAALRTLLRDARVTARPVGTRAGPLATAWRIVRHLRRSRLAPQASDE